jgi:hypothetical protein
MGKLWRNPPMEPLASFGGSVSSGGEFQKMFSHRAAHSDCTTWFIVIFYLKGDFSKNSPGAVVTVA